MMCMHSNRECDGCMNCQETKEYLCDKCGVPIPTGYAYRIDDMLLCEDCVDELYVVSLEQLKEDEIDERDD